MKLTRRLRRELKTLNAHCPGVQVEVHFIGSIVATWRGHDLALYDHPQGVIVLYRHERTMMCFISIAESLEHIRKEDTQ
jgi:hypothetical protein